MGLPCSCSTTAATDKQCTPDEKGTYLDAQAGVGDIDEHEAHSPKSVVIFGESPAGPMQRISAKDVSARALSSLGRFLRADLASNFYWFLPCACSRFLLPPADTWRACMYQPRDPQSDRRNRPVSHARRSSGGERAQATSRIRAITTPRAGEPATD